MQDMAAARLHMVEGQVRTNDVTDKRITEAMGRLERERFVPDSKRALAYSDVCVEVKPGRFLLDPRCLAKLAQLADIRESDRVLDVGCATGYSSAVLSALSADVVALAIATSSAGCTAWWDRSATAPPPKARST
jgi:protein-L-isoaspartate(D-aspartate) O-methyltransferase